ncbi:SIS domain-containing protein [Boudabousia marimammalium]|uniref:SIS domain-containing protein n=1 Tax=Boudabousia marimammalium TaxID=156892 RepID=A0A1Q5PMC9_9ACTO|nr:SIS domain-containing protein [Boudabousia marimammalium]OKL48682.1 hypothetical protein BM477_05660 [Boudabousia marimammalium]
MPNYNESVTYTEILQQTNKWRALQGILSAGMPRFREFLEPLLSNPKLRIVLTGAGTSAFVGEIAAPALQGSTKRRVEQVPTTTIVSNPREVFAEDVPVLLVSFARSGNSPESVAATHLADQVAQDVHHLIITCAEDGQLAVDHRDRSESLVVIMPEGSNDKGFAMTSSFSCMLLSVLVLLGGYDVDLLPRLADTADEMVERRHDQIEALAQKLPERVVYLGSGPLHGLAHEASLKFLELTAGDHLAFFESSLGFRHGPKAVIDDQTQVFVFVSSDAYTRQYDLDIIKELRGNIGVDAVLALSATDVELENAWVLDDLQDVPDAFVAVVHVMVAQLMGVFTSAALGKTIDNPFPAGDVNRVVKGVIIHGLPQ